MKSGRSEIGGEMSDNETVSCADQRLFHILEQIKPALAPDLINAEGYARLTRIASLLPLDLSTFWGFECRLGQRKALADILFEIKKDSPGAAVLAGQHPSCLDSLCHTWSGWRALRAFAKCWLESEQSFHHHIRNIWLEFDLAEAGSQADLQRAVAHPNFFFGPEAQAAPEEILAVTEEVMGLLGRAPIKQSRLQWFLQSLPEKAKLFQVGVMLTREGDHGLRLCVNKLAPESVLPWLETILPASESAGLASILATLMPMNRHIAFGFHLTDKGVDPAIGMECYMDWLVDDPGQWSPLLDYLNSVGRCLPEKVQALRDYVGITASPLRQRLTATTLYLHTFRKIHHLKCTLIRGEVAQAKAYLAVSRPGIALADIFPAMIAPQTNNSNAWATH